MYVLECRQELAGNVPSEIMFLEWCMRLKEAPTSIIAYENSWRKV